jgi:uncharacterized protein YegP (UPF0339 family)
MAIHDNYLPCEQYNAAPESDNYPGFKTWFDADTNHWYFAVVTNTGRVVLRSEGYTSEAGRNNGIESVMRNRDLEERYSVVQDEEDNNWYVVLKAGNRQEIGRSCAYGSESNAKLGAGACLSSYTEVVATAIETSAKSATAAGRINEDYLSCEEYKDQPSSSYERFTSFYNEADSQHYFALVDGQGDVLLRSEGYSSEAGRNNGIESVQRNRNMEERYSVVQAEDGLWYLSLKAGNRQEIARSCGHTSEAGARAIIGYSNSTYTQVVETKTETSTVVSEQIVAKSEGTTTKVYADQIVTKSDVEPTITIRNADTIVTQSTGETTKRTSDTIVTQSTEELNITTRTSDTIVTQGTAETTKRTADTIVTQGTYEPKVSRIVSEPVVTKGTYVPNVQRTVIEKKAEPIIVEKIVVEPEIIEIAPVEEDYLHCSDYEGKPDSSYDGFTSFQNEANSLYYFSMVNEDGKVVLKSEGYVTETARNNGIESVLRNREIKERWVQAKDNGGHYLSLRAGNRQEIARTCHHEDEKSLMGWWMPFSAAWVWGTRKKVEYIETKGEEAVVESIQVETPIAETPVSVQVEERIAAPVFVPEPIIEVKKEKEYQPQWKKKEKKHYVEEKKPVVVEKKVVVEEVKPVVVETAKYEAPKAAYVEPVVEEVADGGGWWKWLLGALLLGALAFMLMRGCGGCNKAKVETPVVSVPTPTPEPTKVETPAPVVATPECNCSTNTDPLFNIGTGTPKSLSRLGTNPEFGNSHDLTPVQFYEKLAAANIKSGTHHRFLDRVFKGMGYENGFKDAKPEMFSNHTFAPGTVGNIGYSREHKTLLARLDTQPRDLEAFKIKSKNGCDMHFMKTCGNHMFTCNK